jgi:hypothetical protein
VLVVSPGRVVAESVTREATAESTLMVSVDPASGGGSPGAYAHKLAQQPNPCTAEAVKIMLAGIRRTLGTAPRRKAAATALLALGFAGALRRSELVALRVDDLTEVADGFRVLIRRSKTDQTGEGQEIVVPRGLKIRPVEAVQNYLRAAGVTDGLASGRCTEAVTCVPTGCAGTM